MMQTLSHRRLLFPQRDLAHRPLRAGFMRIARLAQGFLNPPTMLRMILPHLYTHLLLHLRPTYTPVEAI